MTGDRRHQRRLSRKEVLMVQHLIVPVDGSSQSWKAFDVALALAVRCDADIRVVHVAFEPHDRKRAQDELGQEIDQRGPFDVEVTIEAGPIT